MTEDEFMRFVLGRSANANEVAQLQVLKEASRSSGIDPAIFSAVFAMRERADRADLPAKIHLACEHAIDKIKLAVARVPSIDELQQIARFRAELNSVAVSRKGERQSLRWHAGMMAGLIAAMFMAGVICGNRLATETGTVSDQVYRLEVLGAGWELYRSQLSRADIVRADRFMAHHAIYLPNPR